MTLQQAWDGEADNWTRVARDTMSDASFWSYHLSVFLDLLPPSTGRTLDFGCGDGRLARELVKRGAVRS